MKKSKKYFILIISVVATVTMIFSQGDGYLSQKLMVENNIRDRVKDALSKLIESHKYVINVDVELEVLEEVNEQFTYYAPRSKKTLYLINSLKEKNHIKSTLGGCVIYKKKDQIILQKEEKKYMVVKSYI